MPDPGEPKQKLSRRQLLKLVVAGGTAATTVAALKWLGENDPSNTQSISPTQTAIARQQKMIDVLSTPVNQDLSLQGTAVAQSTPEILKLELEKVPDWLLPIAAWGTCVGEDATSYPEGSFTLVHSNGRECALLTAGHVVDAFRDAYNIQPDKTLITINRTFKPKLEAMEGLSPQMDIFFWRDELYVGIILARYKNERYIPLGFIPTIEGIIPKINTNLPQPDAKYIALTFPGRARDITPSSMVVCELKVLPDLGNTSQPARGPHESIIMQGISGGGASGSLAVNKTEILGVLLGRHDERQLVHISPIGNSLKDNMLKEAVRQGFGEIASTVVEKLYTV